MGKIEFSTAGKRLYDSKPQPNKGGRFPAELRFFLNYERTAYNIKPENWDIGYFAEQITKGRAFYPCVLSNKGGLYRTVNQNCFEYADMVAFDLEKGEHSEEKIKQALIDIGLVPTIVYRTYSHRQGENGDRNRVIYKLPYRLYKKQEYLLLGVLFRAIYWDMDTACIDTARLFYGTNNPTVYVNDAAALDLALFVSVAMDKIAEMRLNDTEKYNDVIRRLQESKIGCAIDEDSGLPCVSVVEGELSYKEDLAAKARRLTKDAAMPLLTDAILDNRNEAITKIPIHNWMEKALCEPLYRELAESRGHYGYKKAMVLVASYRFIDADDVKENIFNLLSINGHRFSDIEHTIREALRIWELPTNEGAGYGCRPLPYSHCDMLTYDNYSYPLTFLRNTKRTLMLRRNLHISEDLRQTINVFDFDKNPKGLIVNGGMGLGKTYSSFIEIKPQLDKKLNSSLKVLYLSSRKASIDQAKIQYINYIDDDYNILPVFSRDKITAMTYHKFMIWKDSGVITENTFDVIIADECHSLAMDDFARQMGGFLMWAIERYKGIIIWITANANYMKDIFKSMGFTQELRMVYENEGENLIMRYDTESIDFYSHSNIDYAIFPVVKNANRENRILVYLTSAEKCHSYYRRAKKLGYRAAFWVSEYCDTELKQEQDMDDYVRDFLDKNKRISMTLSEAFVVCEDERSRSNLVRLKDALMGGENYPEDIDIIFTTNALRESINIKDDSNVKTVITDSFTEVEILQQRGRLRRDVEKLIIVPQRQGTLTGLMTKVAAFEKLMGCSQQELGQEYGAEIEREKKLKGKTAYVIKDGDESKDEAVYKVNMPAYYGLLKKIKEFELLQPTTAKSQTILDEVFGCLSSMGSVNIVYEPALRRRFVDMKVREVAAAYKGLPLVGSIADKLMEDCQDFLRKDNGDTAFGMKLILREMRDAGYEVKNGQIGKKHQQQGIDLPLRTKFRYIA